MTSKRLPIFIIFFRLQYFIIFLTLQVTKAAIKWAMVVYSAMCSLIWSDNYRGLCLSHVAALHATCVTSWTYKNS